MNEKIFISFQQDGKTLPATELNPHPEDGGIVLSGESSAFPRGYGLNVWPSDPATSERVWRVRRRLDWRARELRFNLSRHHDRLVITGIDADALPAGRYDVEFLLGGVRFKRSHFRSVRIEEDGAADLVFEAKPDKYRFKLNTEVGDIRGHTKRILNGCDLDGMPAALWLQPDVKDREVRKACLMNILAKLSIVPSRADRLNQFVHKVLRVEADRVYAQVDTSFLKKVQDGFLPPDLFIDTTHKRLLKEITNPDDYELVSYREKKGAGALQVVVAKPKSPRADGTDVLFADIDIDGSNPSYDLARFVTHCGHLIPGKTTDHFKIRTRIAAQTGDFLYYDAVPV